MRTELVNWRAALLATLGISSLACGGATNEPGEDGSGATGGDQARAGSSASGGSGGSGATGGIARAGSGGATVGGRAGAATFGGEHNVAGSAGRWMGGAGGPVAGSGARAECMNPRPFLPRGPNQTSGAAPLPPDDELVATNGFIQCDGGWLHRPTAGECASFLPRPALPEQPGAPCNSDEECTAGPHGYCDSVPPGGRACRYGCVTDSDCENDQICTCAYPVGICSAATCATDGDCDGGLCVGTPSNICVESYSFACQGPSDECLASAECGSANVCEVEPEGRRCRESPVCGRPFLVHGEARLASALFHCTPDRTLGPHELDSDTRDILAGHWADLGLMEHASVAAFARFTLELLSLGAPVELLEETQRALGDEIAHTKSCFELASAYAGRVVSAGPLAISGTLDDRSRAEIVRTAFLEACIGETIAAVEARSALEAARDPRVVETLTRIAEDEARHAELGWKFVKWALETSSVETRAELTRELGELLELELGRESSSLQTDSLEGLLAQHGLLGAAAREASRRTALRELVKPWADALLAHARPRAAA